MRALALALATSAILAPSALAAPVITPKLFGTTGDNGWYRSNVLLNWTVSDDAGLAILAKSGCDPSTVTADTPPSGVTFTCSATSELDPWTTITRRGTVVVAIDRIAPVAVAAGADRAPDGGGWYNHPLQVTWSATDGGSGIASCTSTPYAGPDGTGITLTGSCRDKAGNVSATVPFVFNYDATPPTLGNVQANAEDRSVILTWQAADASQIVVTRTAGGAQATQSGVVYSGTGAGFTDGGLTNGVRYTYTVQAFDPAANVATASIVITPSAAASSVPLIAPPSRAELTGPPMLRWRPIKAASYYNVQLYRHGRKILSVWPKWAHYQLRSKWRYGGRTFHLGKGTYRWYVWGGYGHRSKHRYGKLRGTRSFKII